MTVLPLIASLQETASEETCWGSVTWLISGKATKGAEQTFGVVTIAPGCDNPLHLHSNCEETSMCSRVPVSTRSVMRQWAWDRRRRSASHEARHTVRVRRVPSL